MSWLDSIIPTIKRRRKRQAKSVPEGLWSKCDSCEAAIFDRDFDKNCGVCDSCGHHHALTPALRARMLFDPDTGLKSIGDGVRPLDFLRFLDMQSYKERLKKLGAEEPEREAMHIYLGTLGERPAVAACFDFSFMGGSMGSVVGERFSRGVDVACDRGAPFIVFTSSGGARMQEGLTSLMQMAKTAAAQAKLAEYNLPFVSVLCHPTTGGVAASFALVADLVLAEPGATIGFAGPRVIKQTVREELPEGFQQPDFLLKHGSIDMVVDRRELRARLIALTGMLLDGGEQQ